MQDMAAASGLTGNGCIKASLELAARHIIEQAPSTHQAAAAEAFIRESLRIDRRSLWARPLGLPVDAPEQQQRPGNAGLPVVITAAKQPEAK